MSSDSLLKSTDHNQVADLLKHLFTSEWLESHARSSRFIERSSSRVSGQMFLMLNVLGLGSSPEDSLQDQCNWLSTHFGVHLKKQSLDERYNTYGVAFLKSCLQEVLGKWLLTQTPPGLGGSFGRILLRDSTSWQLPASLSAFYPSKDSSKTGASIKLDYSLDYLTGQVEQIVLASGRQSDGGINNEHELELHRNDLLIRDLGYWNIRQLTAYHQAGIYFLSRLKSDASLSKQMPDDEWQGVEIEDLLPKNQEHVCHELGLGKKKMPVRVWVERTF